MELFRYRNLALASFSFLVSLFVSYYFNNFVRIATLVLSGVAILSLILVFASSRGKRGLNALIRYTPSAIFIILAMVISLIFFDKSKIEKYCDGKPHEITALVSSVVYDSSYLKSYEIEALEIDGEELNEQLTMTLYSEKPISERSVIKSRGTMSKIENGESSFDSVGYFRSKGITVNFQTDSYTLLEIREKGISDLLKDVNQALDSRFAGVDDKATHNMLSALFLGNKQRLSNTIKRDFSRIGMSHVLALSGMHIAIVVTLLGYVLYLIPISKLWKEMILIVATLLFIGITGFSESALRAGIMVSLTYTLFFFGNRLSLTTALCYSVTLICIFNPFSIFSMSLQLSFIAMLGCIFSAKIIHSSRRLRFLKPRIIRYIFYSLLTSFVISLFTLPLISVSFGRISLISPVSNLILGPLFSILIFLSPVYLIVANIPFVSPLLAWLCRIITHTSTSLGSYMSSLDNITAPIISTIQLVGIIIASVFIISMLLLPKRFFLCAKIGYALGILVFVVGTILPFCKREANVYVSAHNYNNSSDIVCVEDGGQITVIDITNTTVSAAGFANHVTSSLGFYEIDNYVIADLSPSTDRFFDRLSDITVIRRLYLRTPSNKDEETIYKTVKDIATEKGISIMPLGKNIQMERSIIRFADKSYVSGSSKRAIALSVECQGNVFTYLGSGAFELYDDFVHNSTEASDVMVFGTYGPKYKTPYIYNSPYLDYAVFLGESQDFAAPEFYKRIENLQSNKTRFCLTP